MPRTKRKRKIDPARLELPARLRKFMVSYVNEHGMPVDREIMAKIIHTPVKTVEGWIYGDMPPPGSMLFVMDVLETDAKYRKIHGLRARR